MKERNIKIDLLKGIAIILVIIGHIIQYSTYMNGDFFSNKIFIFIYSFHMPLFMLISGFLFYYSINKPVSVIIKNKAKTILYPIITFTMLRYYIKQFIDFFGGAYYTILLNAGWIKMLDSLWFLWSLFASIIVVSIVEKSKHNRLKFLLFILLIPLLYIFPNGDYNFFLYIFFLIGYEYNKHKEKFRWIKIFKYTSIIIFPLLLMLWKKDYYIYITGMIKFDSVFTFSQFYIDIIRTIYGIFGYLFISSIIDIILLVFNNENCIIKKIANIGKYSLHIYVLQTIIIELLFDLLCQKLYEVNILSKIRSNMVIYYCIFIPGVLIICLLIIKVIIKYVEKSKKSKYIFGR